MFPADARTHIRGMTPRELKSLMARTRASSEMLGEVLGISPVQIRKWRGGARPVPDRHINPMRSFFAERAGALGIDRRTLPEIPERIDPAAIAPPPVAPSAPAVIAPPAAPSIITVSPRGDRLPPANTSSIVNLVNEAVAAIVGSGSRMTTGRRAVPASLPTQPSSPAAASTRAAQGSAQPFPPARVPQPADRPAVIRSGPPAHIAPLDGRPTFAGVSYCAYWRQGGKGEPGRVFCAQLAAPWSDFCAEHFVEAMRRA